MRRVVFILAVTLLPMAVWGQTDDDLPYVDVKKDAAGMEGLYDEEDKERTVFVEATKGNITTLYDVTGEVVVPAQKHTTESKYYKRNTKKYLVPYLHALSGNKERYEERVDDAFRRSTWFEPKAAPTPREYSMVASIEQHERQQQEELSRPALENAEKPSSSLRAVMSSTTALRVSKLVISLT